MYFEERRGLTQDSVTGVFPSRFAASFVCRSTWKSELICLPEWLKFFGAGSNSDAGNSLP
jgi:hypothetical protein